MLEFQSGVRFSLAGENASRFACRIRTARSSTVVISALPTCIFCPGTSWFARRARLASSKRSIRIPRNASCQLAEPCSNFCMRLSAAFFILCARVYSSSAVGGLRRSAGVVGGGKARAAIQPVARPAANLSMIMNVRTLNTIFVLITILSLFSLCRFWWRSTRRRATRAMSQGPSRVRRPSVVC